jgi:hypothetical protein
MRRISVLVAVIVVLSLVACGSPSRSGGSQGSDQPEVLGQRPPALAPFGADDPISGLKLQPHPQPRSAREVAESFLAHLSRGYDPAVGSLIGKDPQGRQKAWGLMSPSRPSLDEFLHRWRDVAAIKVIQLEPMEGDSYFVEIQVMQRLGAAPSAPTQPAMAAAGPIDLCTREGTAGKRMDRAVRKAAFAAGLAGHLAKTGSVPVEQALQGFPPCIEIEPVAGGGSQVAIVDLKPGGVLEWLPHVVYWDGSAWRVHPLERKKWPESIHPLYVSRTAQGLDMIAQSSHSGSGGQGTLLLYRLGAKMKLIWEGPVSGEHLSVWPLKDEYLVTIDRAPETYQEPHADPARLPQDRQTLWKRTNDQLEPVAQRTIPNPYRTVSLFVGALRKGDKALASRYAASPELVAYGLAIIKEIDVTEWRRGDRAFKLVVDEALSWDRIPASLRGSEPAGIETILWPVGRYRLVTTRANGDWKVSAIEAVPLEPSSNLQSDSCRQFITAVGPLPGQMVPHDLPIQVFFNRAIDPVTLSQKTLSITEAKYGRELVDHFALGYDAAARRLSFQPKHPQFGFGTGNEVTVTIRGGLRDAAGVPMGQDCFWSFRT